jgi:hypothetical protein
MSLIGTTNEGYYNLSPIPTSTFKANECASFVLRTSDAVSNAVLTSHTWKNINLRTLMGNDMYDKYDLFMLKPLLQATAANQPSAWGNSLDDRLTVLNIQGLPFKNYFNSSTLTTTSSAIFNTLLTRLAGVATTTNSGSILTFGKYQELVDLTIFYSRLTKNTAGNYQTQTTNPFPHFVFSFEIYGIPKEE